LGQAWASVRLEDYPKALSALEKLLDRDPQSDLAEEAQFLLGHCYLKVGRYEDAVAAFKAIAERYSSNGTSLERLNEIYRELAEKRSTLEALKTDLLVLETKLLESIPLDTGDGVPDFIRQQHKKIEEARNNLFEQILGEHETFEALRQQIETLQRLTVVREVRKDWGSFAEYGITRALFLKSIRQF